MRQHLKSLPIPIVASPALITPIQGVLGVILLPVNRFPNKLGLNVPNNMLRNLFFLIYIYVNLPFSQLLSINQILQKI